jgi:archaellum component FlaG (FlaF/FlaG flagellin family)
MRARMNKRRAVSEIVAALLLLSITVGVFGVFYTYYVSGLNSADTSVAKGIQDSAKATGELMSLVSYQVQGDTVTLYLYNYGLQPITLDPPQQAFFVASGSQQAAQSFSLTDATSPGSPISTIQTQKLAELALTFNSVPGSGPFYVEIIDSIGKNFEFQLSAG